jgi:hypothetical protein
MCDFTVAEETKENICPPSSLGHSPRKPYAACRRPPLSILGERETETEPASFEGSSRPSSVSHSFRSWRDWSPVQAASSSVPAARQRIVMSSPGQEGRKRRSLSEERDSKRTRTD